jgi:hypothetical protein
VKEELDRKFNELWERISGPSAALPPTETAPLSSAQRDLWRDALGQMRRRFENERARWQDLLRTRETDMAALREEKEALEAEVRRSRGDLAALRSELESRLEMEALEKAEAQADLGRSLRRREEESVRLQDAVRSLEAARREDEERLQSVQERWRVEEKAWYSFLEKKNAAMAELQARLQEMEVAQRRARAEAEEAARKTEAAAQETARASEGEKAALRESLETREAEIQNFQRLVRLSQEEIVEFTRNQHRLETELRQSQEQGARLQDENRQVREAWEVERGHWRELWERERASREKWYDNMREWEERLHREREEWLRQFQAELSDREKFGRRAEQTLERLRQAVWTLPVFFGRPRRDFRADDSAWVRWTARPAVRAAAVGLAVSLTAAAVLWTDLSVGPKTAAPAVKHPSGLAVAGSDLWFSEWLSGQVVQAAPDSPGTVRFAGDPVEGAHPVTVRRAPDGLYTLDAWTRVLRLHQAQPPFAVLGAWPVAVANPVDLAWDGQGLWVLDREEQTLRRFNRGDFLSADRTVSLPAGWRLAALDFQGGEFWAYDEALPGLRRFTVSAAGVAPTARHSLPLHAGASAPLSSLSVTDRHVWTLSEKSQTVYRWSRRRLAWRSALRLFPPR